jgi:hypothetical protein
MDQVTKFLCWCDEHLRSGVGPLLGFYGEAFTKNCMRHALRGQKLAGDWRACFAGFKADGKARRECHHFCRHAQATFICDECLAVQLFPNAPAELNFTNVSDGAPWTRTIFTTAQYLAHDPRPSPWKDMCGWNLELNLRDGPRLR